MIALPLLYKLPPVLAPPRSLINKPYNMKTLFSGIFTCLLIFACTPSQLIAQTDDMSNDDMATEEAGMESNTIVDLASNNTDLSYLVAALNAADLVSTLQGEGPFTVFAPTNEAFLSLPEGVLEALLKAENRQALVDILMYHVAEGQLAASDVTAAIEGTSDGEFMATTLNGDFTASINDGNVMLMDGMGTEATVTQADVMASNGVIHIIDKVLIPANVNVEALLAGEAMGAADDAEQMATDATESATAMGESVVEEGQETMEEGQEMVEGTVAAGQEAAQDVRRTTQEMGNEVGETIEDAAMTADSMTTEMGMTADSMTSSAGMEMDTEMDMDTDMQSETATPTGNMTRRSGTQNTIVDVAAGNSDFKTLLAAVEAADLVDLLSNSESDFTVFAPTEEAFGKLPEGTVGELTQASNKEKLQGILSYHVIANRLSAADLTKAINANKGYFRLQTISGQTLIASMMDGMIMLTDGEGNMAHVTTGDVEADNGVIHVIDNVLMPKTK